MGIESGSATHLEFSDPIERETQRDRETERQRGRESARERESEREREREREEGHRKRQRDTPRLFQTRFRRCRRSRRGLVKRGRRR